MQRARSAEAKDIRRQILLEAALDEFYERGFSAARMGDIAKRAGLSKGALYLYFDSKEGLFAALIESVAVPNLTRMEGAIEMAGGGLNAIRAVMKLAPVIMRESLVPKLIKVLIGDAQNFPALATSYRKTVVERVLTVISGVLKSANNAGEIEIDDPALIARLVVSPIIFSAIWRVTFEHDEEAVLDLDALFAVYKNYLMKALGAKEART